MTAADSARRTRLSGALISLVLAPLAWADEPPCAQDRGIVQLRAGESIAAFHARNGTTTLAAFAAQNLYLVTLPPGVAADQFEAFVATDPGVLHADLNCEVSIPLLDGSTRSIFFNVASEAYSTQPAMDLIGASSAVRQSGGPAISVAVLDTGVGPHAYLTARLLSGFDVLSGGTNTTDVGDGLDNDGDGLADEMVGHGTMIAGLITRVAASVRILPIKVMDDEGLASTFSLTQGIYLAASAGARVLNISMGQTVESDVLAAAVSFAGARGALIVAAAGNDDRESPLRYPAGLPHVNVLAVASTSLLDARSVFSNFGTHIDLSAPGETLVSLLPGGAFAQSDGTSFATPLVAGAAAGCLFVRPSSTPTQLREFILGGALIVDPLNPGFEGRLGAGRLRADQALRHARLGIGARPSAPRNRDASQR